MGKKSDPAPPPAPDPYGVAAAQTGENISTAIANANLNRINQYTPYGNLTYSVDGYNPDGTPQYSQHQTLSDAGQSQLNAQNAIAQQLTGFAGNEIGRVQGAVGQPFDLSNAPSFVGGINLNQLPSWQNAPQSGAFMSSIPDAGNITNGIANSGNITSNFNGGPGPQTGVAPSGNITTGVGATPGPQYNIGNAGSITNSFAGGGNITGGVNTSGLPGMSPSSGIQNNVNLGQYGNLPTTADFQQQAQQVQQSLYARQTAMLDPQYQQQQSDLESRLANMGISRDSAAWQREMDNFSRERDNAYASARNDSITGAGAEQSRLFGMNLASDQQGASNAFNSGQFANAAQAQGFGQNIAARNQMFGEALNTAQFANQAQQQQFGQNQAQAQFADQAQQQQFGQNAASQAAYNQAQGQQFSQNVNTAQFANQAQAQQYGQNLDTAQFYNQAQNQGFNQAQAQAGFANQAQQQQYGENMGTAQFANQAQQQQFGQNQQNLDAHNQATQSTYANDLNTAGFNNQAIQQRYQMLANNATMQNAARQQYIQEAAYQRNLPLNELSALMGATGGVTNPSFSGVPSVSMAAPALDQYMYNSYQGNLNAWNTQQQANASMKGGIAGSLGSLGGAAIMASDPRMKENVTRIGELADGTPTYVFNYLGEDKPQFGVMADEVAHIPGAVIDGPVRMVNYQAVYSHV